MALGIFVRMEVSLCVCVEEEVHVGLVLRRSR